MDMRPERTSCNARYYGDEEVDDPVRRRAGRRRMNLRVCAVMTTKRACGLSWLVDVDHVVFVVQFDVLAEQALQVFLQGGFHVLVRGAIIANVPLAGRLGVFVGQRRRKGAPKAAD